VGTWGNQETEDGKGRRTEITRIEKIGWLLIILYCVKKEYEANNSKSQVRGNQGRVMREE
jgi:hypothetical protein